MKKLLFLITATLFLSTMVSAAPSAKPLKGNIDLPITQLDFSQNKNSSLTVNKFVVGEWKSLPTELTIFTSTGKLGVRKIVSDLNNLPNITDTFELGSGGVRLSEISTAGIAICADSKGTIVKCESTVYSHSGNNKNPYETFTYKVPTGVNKITVELYGAGGAGYFLSASSYDRSSDNYSGCSSGNNYLCGSGGSAYLYDLNNSSKLLLQAKGGQVATAKHTVGKGGTTFVDSDSKILSSSVVNGADGTDGTNGASFSQQTFSCGSATNYTATIGGTGGTGGTGGKSGPYGGTTPGGFGGKEGMNILDYNQQQRCRGVYVFQNGKGFLSDGGINGQFGAGGSGAGGIGGYSDRGGDFDNDKDSLCSKGAKCPGSDQGYAGGGGGGYIKAQLSVKGGETYRIRLAHGGNVQAFTEDKGDVWCYSIVKDICHGGSYSGNGSGAYAIVTAN